MGYFSTVCVMLFLVLFFLAGFVVSGVAFLVGLLSQDKKDRINTAYVRFGFRVILFLSNCPVEVVGMENIPEKEAALFIGNHRGMFDVVALGSLPLPLIGFVAKAELEKVPFLNGWMRRIHCLFLDRKDIRQGMQMILSAIDLLKEGRSLCIFPEGTRNTTADPLLPFHAGSFKIALKAGAPIVPFVINGTEGTLEDHFPRIDGHRIRIEFGTPVPTAGADRTRQKEIPEEVRTWIEEKYLAQKEA
ncbi:MAG: 1-acyl-sn-glycerol-3-phosphate acyltransferase [Lachnospiraceae bacterium]|nr:1-acyl-sn-glycerol-3-phosphate acyltransferase [Lachnospiraceae bacterium]